MSTATPSWRSSGHWPSCWRAAQVKHDQLVAAGGLYARLYRMNYASFDDIPAEEIARAIINADAILSA